MPKYIIRCTTSRSYHLVVEAPTKDLVHEYYELSSGEQFHAGGEECWELAEVQELPERTTYSTDVALDGPDDVLLNLMRISTKMDEE